MHQRLACALLCLAAMAAPATAAGEHDPAGLRSPDLMPGESFFHTFTESGRLDYHCHPHPWMLAAITIVASTGRAPVNHTVEIIEPANEGFENWTWSPKTLTVEVGDTVTWVNKGAVMHVVQETTEEHLEHVGTAGGDGTHLEGDGHGKAGGLAWPWVLGLLVGGLLLFLVFKRK